jgi:hypothetical protein
VPSVRNAGWRRRGGDHHSSGSGRESARIDHRTATAVRFNVPRAPST